MVLSAGGVSRPDIYVGLGGPVTTRILVRRLVKQPPGKQIERVRKKEDKGTGTFIVMDWSWLHVRPARPRT